MSRRMPGVDLRRGTRAPRGHDSRLCSGVQLTPEARPVRAAAERLLAEGVLAKDTHESTIRLAPPLVITQDELGCGLDRVLKVLGG
jgi:ornithine--oxo-acid transaminase